MEISSSSFAPRVAAVQSRTTATARVRTRVGFDNGEDDGQGPSASARPAPVKVGFGGDSVKLPGVTVSTIKRNVRQARELVPTLEESSERVRERLDDDARTVRDRDRERARSLDLNAPRETAVNAARSIVSSVNTAAGEALARTGQGDQPIGNRLDIRIGNAQVPFDKPPSKAPLDLLA